MISDVEMAHPRRPLIEVTPPSRVGGNACQKRSLFFHIFSYNPRQKLRHYRAISLYPKFRVPLSLPASMLLEVGMRRLSPTYIRESSLNNSQACYHSMIPACTKVSFSGNLFSFLLIRLREVQWMHFFQIHQRDRVINAIGLIGGFVLPISSHVTILLGSFRIILLLAFVAQICMSHVTKYVRKIRSLIKRLIT